MIVDRAKLERSMMLTGLTRQEVVKRGVAQSTFQRIYHGKNIMPATVGKLARALNINPLELLAVDQEKE